MPYFRNRGIDSIVFIQAASPEDAALKYLKDIEGEDVPQGKLSSQELVSILDHYGIPEDWLGTFRKVSSERFNKARRVATRQGQQIDKNARIFEILSAD